MNSRFLFLAFVPFALLGLASCRGGDHATQIRAIGGDPNRGKASLAEYGCSACHVISGVTSAVGRAGPPLTGIAERSYLAGVVPNTPDNMIAWIMNPQSINPRTAMPNLSVPEGVARDMVTYLYVAVR